MSVTISFTPAVVARSVFECQDEMASVQALGNATVCLHISETSKYKLGESSCPVSQDALTSETILPPSALPTWGVSGSLSPHHAWAYPPTGNLQSSVTFDLALDPGRPSPRAIFKERRTRTLTRVQILGLNQHCEVVDLLLPVRGPQIDIGENVDSGLASPWGSASAEDLACRWHLIHVS
jgi:hypothetical protein